MSVIFISPPLLLLRVLIPSLILFSLITIFLNDSSSIHKIYINDVYVEYQQCEINNIYMRICSVYNIKLLDDNINSYNFFWISYYIC